MVDTQCFHPVFAPFFGWVFSAWPESEEKGSLFFEGVKTRIQLNGFEDCGQACSGIQNSHLEIMYSDVRFTKRIE